jgi:hypothetical protein
VHDACVQRRRRRPHRVGECRCVPQIEQEVTVARPPPKRCTKVMAPHDGASTPRQRSRRRCHENNTRKHA